MVDVTTTSGRSSVLRRPRPTRVGIVTSDRGDKSIRVECRYVVKQPKYGKYIRRRSVVHAHDEKNEASVGDRVEVASCRPMSKMKHWRLVRVLERA